MDESIASVTIVGGGTAGWMAAAYLHKELHGQVTITVIEADTIPKIGVGEATVPNLQRVFWDALGIDEFEWMRRCNAGFKTAVKFVNWRPRVDETDNHFYHLFGVLPNCQNIPLSHFWLSRLQRGDTTPFDYACFREPLLLDQQRAPFALDGTQAMVHAWHFDAHKVAAYLRELAKGWGVRHVVEEIEDVELAPDGKIAAVRGKTGQRYAADLFIDCSGFRGLLINKALQEPFVDMSDHLLCDSAVAASIADSGERGVDPYTSAIALDGGWVWKIPMLDRFGSGYVYSSKFVSRDTATADFLKLWGLSEKQVTLNQIRFRVGRNRRAWVRNCVSLGLASCFLEPLESTGIYFIYAALYQLAKHFPNRHCDERLADSFNRAIESMFDDCRDFIQAHYLVTQREDTPFWRANKHELVVSDGIREKMEMYRAGLPVNMPITDETHYYQSFEAEFRNYWTNGSYYCIFAGLGFVPERPMPIVGYKPQARRAADDLLAKIQAEANRLAGSLPSNYEFLRQLHGRTPAHPQPLRKAV